MGCDSPKSSILEHTFLTFQYFTVNSGVPASQKGILLTTFSLIGCLPCKFLVFSSSASPCSRLRQEKRFLRHSIFLYKIVCNLCLLSCSILLINHLQNLFICIILYSKSKSAAIAYLNAVKGIHKQSFFFYVLISYNLCESGLPRNSIMKLSALLPRRQLFLLIFTGCI